MTDLNRSASSRERVTIYYRFHPLRGRRFRAVKSMPGPPPVYVVQRADGRRFSIPVWMAERTAAELDLSDTPGLDPSALIELAGFVAGALCDLNTIGGKLPGKSACKEGHNEGSKSMDAVPAQGVGATRAADPRPNQRRTASTHRRTTAPGRNEPKDRRGKSGGAK